MAYFSSWTRTMEGKLDGGLSWVVAFAAFFQQFVMMGSNYVFGAFFIALLDEFKESKAITGLVGSLAFGLSFVLGPITTIICHKLGNRVALFIGSVFFSLGLLLTSFVDDLSRMFLTYSVMVGFGGSLCYYTSILILNEYFCKRLVTANGLTLSGSGLGTLALSAAVEHFLELHGWRIAFRILCVFSLIQFVSCGIQCVISAPIKTDSALKDKVSKNKFIDTSLFKNKAYIVWVFVISMVLFGFYIPYVHLIRHCQDLNIPRSKAAILVGYLAISSTIGKIITGRIADHPRVDRLILFQFFLLVCSVLTTLFPIMTSLETVTIYCWLFGFQEGGFVVLIAIITGDIVGKEKMASAFGVLYGFSCIPMMIGPPVAGMMYGISNSYNPAFFMSAALTALSVCISFLIPVLLPQEIIEKSSMRNTAEEIQMPSTGSSTNNNSKNSSVDQEAGIKLIETKTKNDGVFMERSGATRTLRKRNKNEGTTNRLSLDFQLYFSMEHLVSQRDSLISSFYSRENLNHPAPVPEVRETDV
ncbi:monocarboxylate transporter 14-like isoform X2 [Actinia tenebrosa]|uniref:Monocarboxylate transporter 14-like isoform X2 n=1 Tax=Actinia tenebrosa TaxID=6105 RepID=A0A6P8J5H1_ACTTE|nr:monocarboxylate transporter 14-like isoform X2 [Actinia tenebrosa]